MFNRASFMPSRQRWTLAALAALVISLFVPVLIAQTNSGSIFGTVTDATGAVVPGATITVTDQATNRAVSVERVSMSCP